MGECLFWQPAIVLLSVLLYCYVTWQIKFFLSPIVDALVTLWVESKV